MLIGLAAWLPESRRCCRDVVTPRALRVVDDNGDDGNTAADVVLLGKNLDEETGDAPLAPLILRMVVVAVEGNGVVLLYTEGSFAFPPPPPSPFRPVPWAQGEGRGGGEPRLLLGLYIFSNVLALSSLLNWRCCRVGESGLDSGGGPRCILSPSVCSTSWRRFSSSSIYDIAILIQYFPIQK